MERMKLEVAVGIEIVIVIASRGVARLARKTQRRTVTAMLKLVAELQMSR